MVDLSARFVNGVNIFRNGAKACVKNPLFLHREKSAKRGFMISLGIPAQKEVEPSVEDFLTHCTTACHQITMSSKNNLQKVMISYG